MTNLALRRDKARIRRLKKTAASARNRRKDPKDYYDLVTLEIFCADLSHEA